MRLFNYIYMKVSAGMWFIFTRQCHREYHLKMSISAKHNSHYKIPYMSTDENPCPL